MMDWRPRQLADPISAVLICEVDLSEISCVEPQRMGKWSWRDAGSAQPTDLEGHQLPGGADGGIFLINGASFELPGRDQWWGGAVKLEIGVRNYLDIAVDMLPAQFREGSLTVPSLQMMCARVYAWTWSGQAPEPPQGVATFVLHGKWAKELRS